jgi:hypothetical protein
VDVLEEATNTSGFPIARATLRALLSRASKEGVVERVSVGHYRLPQKDEPHDADEPNNRRADQQDTDSSEEASVKDTLGNPTPFSPQPATHTRNLALEGNDEVAASSFPITNPNRRPA